MALFQKTVIKKHLLELNSIEVDSAFQRFSAYFHDTVRQQNIRNSKEEQFQEGFLRELFGHIFGYTLNPEPNFNLTTELKNTSNSKKADGAIVFEGKAVAVIELKGTETTDLNKIETQAFGYKNNQPECVYVITSNFEKLRFYIDNSIDYEEFNLFTLNREQFNLLYLCLSLPSIQQNLPKRLKDESVSQEDVITKKLYKDYSEFKRALYQNLVELNPEIDKLLLFKKTQKLLDRFLFIFFAEDRLLLPTNLIFRINQEWKNLMKMRMTVSLYERYKVYFNDLNVGAKVTLPAFGKKTGDAIEAEFEIFAYNGGLFVPDEVLDHVKIDDEVLHVHTEKMSHYDFDSDVDVNILGHIFENSLNEIDEIKSEIEGGTVDKTKTRRKKDGVFYTPKYITKYIVDNTVGKLCAEKKAELNLVDEDYTNDKKIQTKTKKAHLDKLNEYRAWLLQLTICDPACGSGAFLNQALEFLIAEHRYVDELQAKLMGDSLILSDVENSILENNLFGVDLNDESVEIAKLSLWLRTAQKGRKLNSLNKNIKCGNSLIDDPEVAGDKAFSWEKEFPTVFKEKQKFPFHITTSIHDSRTSERMIKYQARERRFNGTKPDPEVFPMTKEEEELIATTVAEIVKEDKLNIAAFNLCWDHMHILLVCEEEEVPKIMQKIKAKTGRAVNIFRGKTIVADFCTKGAGSLDGCGHTTPRGEKQNSFWTQKFGCKPITTDEQFWNTYNYIENNKVKHDLPKNPKLEKIILGFVKTYEDCFKPEYKGGFDVVIGNPPYVRSRDLFSEKEKNFYLNNYQTTSYQLDLYKLFIEKSCKLINENGKLSFITPSVFLTNDYDIVLRKFILENYSLELVATSDKDVFDDASVKTVVFLISRYRNKNNVKFFRMDNSEFRLEKEIVQKTFVEQNYLINEKIDNSAIPIIKKMNEQKKLGEFFEVKNGIKVRKELLFKEKRNENYKPFILGKNISEYQLNFDDVYIDYKLENEKLYTNQAFRSKEIFEQEKLITRQILGKKIITCYDSEHYYTDQTTYIINRKLKEHELLFLLPILNSKLLFYYFQNTFSDNKITFPKVKRSQLLELPYPYKSEKKKLEELAKKQIEQIKGLNSTQSKFKTYLKSRFTEIKLGKKLQLWYEFKFGNFIDELNKAIKTAKGTPLTKKDEFEWMELFEENKKKALALKAEIDQTDKEIDKMVYELYGLTEEEIRIVEGN
jgi:REP element-mobilizing transposase RayT